MNNSGLIIFVIIVGIMVGEWVVINTLFPPPVISPPETTTGDLEGIVIDKYTDTSQHEYMIRVDNSLYRSTKDVYDYVALKSQYNFTITRDNLTLPFGGMINSTKITSVEKGDG